LLSFLQRVGGCVKSNFKVGKHQQKTKATTQHHLFGLVWVAGEGTPRSLSSFILTRGWLGELKFKVYLK